MKKNNAKGFTLIEVLISICILSILTIVFSNVMNNSIKINKKNEVDINAMHLAQTEIENLRVQIKNNSTNIVDLNNNPIILEQTNVYTSGEYTVNILVGKKNDLLYEINVEVEPRNSNFSTKNTQIITQVVTGRMDSIGD